MRKILSEKQVRQIVANANNPNSTSLGRAIFEVNMKMTLADAGVIKIVPCHYIRRGR